MKTVADLKRLIKVGVKLSSVYHLDYVGHNPETKKPIYKDKEMGIRSVSIVQSAQFALETETPKGKRDSWMQFPKVKDLRINEDGSFTILEDGVSVITYKILEE